MSKKCVFDKELQESMAKTRVAQNKKINELNVTILHSNGLSYFKLHRHVPANEFRSLALLVSNRV